MKVQELMKRRDEMDPDARLAYHQEHSEPVMGDLAEWGHTQLDEHIFESNSSWARPSGTCSGIGPP